MSNNTIISAKIQRSGIKMINTKLWDDISFSEQEKLKAKISHVTDQKIILVYFGLNYELLLTKDEIIELSDEIINSFKYNIIDRIYPEEVFEHADNKVNASSLSLQLKNKENKRILIEKHTWPLMYEIINFLKRKH